MVARAHKTLIWERTRHVQRLRHALREYFPAALEAFDDLAAADTLELLAKAPDPASAARLTRSQISAALKRARRRDIDTKADPIQAALRAEQLGQPAGGHRRLRRHRPLDRSRCSPPSTSRSATLQGQVEAHFGRHPDAEIYLSQPGLGSRSSAPGCSPSSATTPAATPTPRPARTTPAPARSPAQSGKQKIVARPVRPQRPARRRPHVSGLRPRCAPHPAPAPTTTSSAPAGSDHHAALRQLANRLVGILHGCLKTRTLYDEATAWSHHNQDQQTAA